MSEPEQIAEYVPDEVDVLRIENGALHGLLSDLADACIEWHVQESEAGRIGAESLDDVPAFCWLAYIARRQCAHNDGEASDGAG